MGDRVGGEGEDQQAEGGGSQRRQRVAHSLEHTGADEDDPGGEEVPADDPQVLRAEGDDPGVGVEEADHPRGCDLAQQRQREHDHGAHGRRRIERLAHPRPETGAVVLAGHGGGGEGDGHRRQEEGLHHPDADAEPRLGGGAEGPDDVVDEDHVHRHQRELAAGGQADP